MRSKLVGLTFHPSTHIDPSDSRLTVPSPSPNTTPLLTWGEPSMLIELSTQTRWARGKSSGGRGVMSDAFDWAPDSSSMGASSCSNSPSW